MKLQLLLAASVIALAGCGGSGPSATPLAGGGSESVRAVPVPPPLEALALPPLPAEVQARVDAIPGATQLPVIDEAAIQRELVVDGSWHGAGDGSATAPFPTIRAAGEAAKALLRQGIPVRILIRPGLYRERLGSLLRGGNENDLFRTTPVVISGTAPGAVVISGAEARPDGHDFGIATWQPVEGRPGLLQRAWPWTWAPDPGPWAQNFGIVVPDVAQRQEALIIDGQPLRQVLLERYRWEDPDGKAGYTDGAGRGADPANRPGSLVFAGMAEGGLDRLDRPGTYGVVTDPAAPAELRQRIFLRPPAGFDPARAAIEVPVPAGDDQPALLTIGKKERVVLRNLVLRHANIGTFQARPDGGFRHGGWHNGALLIQNASDILVEDCRFEDNVGAGLLVRASQRVAIRRCASVGNGRMGFGLNGRELTVEDSEFSSNNRRGGWAGFIGWDPAGTKCGEVDGATFRRVRALGNWSGALWFDVYCTNIRVEQSLFYGNHRLGVQFELGRPNRGGYLLKDSVIAGNDVCGVFPGMVRDCVVVRNVIVDNGFAGVLETEAVRSQVVVKNSGQKTAAYLPADWNRLTLHGNLIATRHPESRLVVELQRKASSEGYGHVLSILDADGNRYDAPTAAAFRVPGSRLTDLAGWRTELAQRGSPGSREAASNWGGVTWAPRPEDEFTAAAGGSTPTRLARALGVPLPEEAIRACQAQRSAPAAIDTVNE